MGDNKEDPFELGRGGIMDLVECYAIVTRAYLVVFGRWPDAEGVEYWAGRMSGNPGLSLPELIREFARSEEGKHRLRDEYWGCQAYYYARGGPPPGMIVLSWRYSQEEQIDFLTQLVEDEATIAYTQPVVDHVLRGHGLAPV